MRVNVGEEGMERTIGDDNDDEEDNEVEKEEEKKDLRKGFMIRDA